MKFASFKSSALKSVGAVSLCVALGAGLVGCGGNGAGGGAVAATVNGQDIMEQTVTDYIANFRTSSSLESDEAWGEWMVANGYTPESVREEVIDYYVNQDLRRPGRQRVQRDRGAGRHRFRHGGDQGHVRV